MTKINLEIIKQIKSSMPIDDNVLDNAFKNVEDNLMSLSKLLSSLYFSSLAVSQQQQQQNNTNSFLQPPNQPNHQQQSSSSVRF